MLSQGDSRELLANNHSDTLIGCGTSCVSKSKNLMNRELDHLDEILVRISQEIVHIARQLLVEVRQEG